MLVRHGHRGSALQMADDLRWMWDEQTIELVVLAALAGWVFGMAQTFPMIHPAGF